MNLRQWARATYRTLSEQREEAGIALSSDVVEQVLRAAISTLADALVDGGELRIDVLGQVWIEEKAARRIASNLTGTQRICAVGNRRVARFRASRRLVAAVNGQFPGKERELVLERDPEVAKEPRKSKERKENV